MSCEEALKAFATALHGYLVVNARRAVEIASLTGQKRIRISLRAIRRFHEPTANYTLFNEALTALLERRSWVRRLGWSLERDGEETYLVMPLESLKSLLSVKSVEILASMLRRAGACSDTA